MVAKSECLGIHCGHKRPRAEASQATSAGGSVEQGPGTAT